jgi:hypothetical protein
MARSITSRRKILLSLLSKYLLELDSMNGPTSKRRSHHSRPPYFKPVCALQNLWLIDRASLLFLSYHCSMSTGCQQCAPAIYNKTWGACARLCKWSLPHGGGLYVTFVLYSAVGHWAQRSQSQRELVRSSFKIFSSLSPTSRH